MVPDEEDPREVVMKYGTQRKMVHWHDHSNIAGKQVIQCMLFTVSHDQKPLGEIWAN